MSIEDFEFWEDAEADRAARSLVCAGLFVAEAEDVEGEEDDLLEVQALIAALERLSKEWARAPLISKMAKRALSIREDWGSCVKTAFRAPAEVDTVATFLREKGASKTDRKDYRIGVLHIARSVAEAADEHEGAQEKKHSFLSRLLGGGHGPDPSNVSAGENAAIARLIEALDTEDS